MAINIGPRPNFLSDIASGYGAAAAGYGQGYGQHSGQIVQGIQNQGEAWTKPIQAAVTQQAGFYNDLAYQKQAQDFRMQMQAQAHQGTIDTLNQRAMLNANRQVIGSDGRPMWSPTTLAQKFSTSTSGGCPGGVCGVQSEQPSQQPFSINTNPSVATEAMGKPGPPRSTAGGAMGPPVPGSVPVQALPDDSWETQWRMDPEGMASGTNDVIAYRAQRLQTKQQQDFLARQEKAGMVMRNPGETQQEFETNKATYNKAVLDARDVLNDPSNTPQENLYAAQQIMKPVAHLAPSWNKKLQPSPQEQAQAALASVAHGKYSNGVPFALVPNGKGGFTIHSPTKSQDQQQEQDPSAPHSIAPGVMMGPKGIAYPAGDDPSTYDLAPDATVIKWVPDQAGAMTPFFTKKSVKDWNYEQATIPLGGGVRGQWDPKKQMYEPVKGTEVAADIAKEQGAMQKEAARNILEVRKQDLEDSQVWAGVLAKEIQTLQKEAVDKASSANYKTGMMGQEDTAAKQAAIDKAKSGNYEPEAMERVKKYILMADFAKRVRSAATQPSGGAAPTPPQTTSKLDAVKERARSGDTAAQQLLKKYGATW